MFIKRKTVNNINAIIFIILFETLTYMVSHAQGVGIGTNNPQATLHVVGTLRVDTVPMVTFTNELLALDTNHQMKSIPVDSLRNVLGVPTWLPVTIFSQEIPIQASTTSATPQSRVTLTLPAGSYLLFAYAEIFSTGTSTGTRMWLYENATEIAFGIPFSNTSTYGSWSTCKLVSPTIGTTYTLSYSSFPNGTTSYIRRARIVALRIS